MDRQKSIPPLSQKITRKLASESADHHHVMSFYSQISRDESGAPKKWKMSNPVQITDQMIPTSASTSGNRDRKSKMLEKKALGNLKKRASSKDSPERNSSRDSSVESNRSSKENKGKRSMSAEATSKSENHVENGVKSEVDTVKKRNRPRSLDLSAKAMTNGDEDNFRSPHPLTPCNVAVKRRKGRPKETPPTLVPESPVEPLTDGTELPGTTADKDSEETTEVPKKKGRKANPNKVVKTKKLGNQFAIKKYDSGVKSYGSKIIKKRLFKKLPQLTTVAKDSKLKSDGTKKVSLSVSKTGNKYKKENDLVSPKRKPGRPPGAKNKPKSPSPDGSSVSPEKRKGGRPPGAKNKSIIGQIPKKRKKQKLENLNEKKNETKDLVKTDDNQSKRNSSPDENDLKQNTDMQTENVKVIEIKTEPSDIASMPNKKEDKISEVVLKADEKKDTKMEVKKQSALRTAHFKDKKGVKSLGKLKKENATVNRVKKKRVLTSLAKNTDCITSLAHLPSNDLRRKLHRKLLEKLNGKRPKNSINTVTDDGENGQTLPESSEKDEINIELEKEIDSESVKEIVNENVMDESVITEPEKTDIDLIETSNDKGIREDVQNLSALVEQKRVNKTETVIAIEQRKKGGRTRKSNSEQRELSKFSDSESVCSELSTQSLGSFKKSVEKQILILGEDNIDSDDNTVRTRQRFEIIRGKKRKRTLSGEFDLLDERELKKQRKKAEQGGDCSADESDITLDDETKTEPKKKSPRKVSPKIRLKKDLVGEKFGRTSSYMHSYRAKLLRQSPFLSKMRRRRHIRSRNRLSSSVSDSELGAYGVDVNEVVKTDNNSEKIVQEELVENVVKTEIIEDQLVKDIDIGINEERKTSPRKERSVSLDECVTLESDTVFESFIEESKNDIVMQSDIMESEMTSVECAVEESVKTVESDCESLLIDCESVVKSILMEVIDKVVGEKTDVKTEISTDTDEKISKPEQEDDAIKMAVLEEPQTKDIENVPESETEKIIQATEITLSDHSHWPSGATPLSSRRGRVRRRRGRRPYKHLLLNNRATHATRGIQKKVRQRKTFQEVSEFGSVTHKFELRQKISRSPLDNIALKQSIEENEYYKNEAQKAVRKELKKAKRSPQAQAHSQESVSVPVSETETEAFEPSEEESVDFVPEETENMTEILLSECRPCSVMLTDFIKQLQLAGSRRVTSDDETENETEESMSDLDRQSEASPVPCDGKNESIETEAIVWDTEQDMSSKPAAADNISEDAGTNMDISINKDSNMEDTEGNVSTKTGMDSSESKLIEDNNKIPSVDSNKIQSVLKEDNMKVPQSYLKTSKSSSPTKRGNIDNKTKHVAKSSVGVKTVGPKQTAVKVSEPASVNLVPFASPVAKSRRTSRKSIQSGARRGRKPQSITIPDKNESQTARKTVPPLKIKVKGGPRSRRKTYMVETITDDQANFKVVKKRSKGKPGNRSESEADKISTSHHKRKSKSPSVENLFSKKSKNMQTSKSSHPSENSKKNLKPTEAYEANFLEFIQNRNSQQQVLPTLYSNVGVKGKPLHQLTEGKAYKVDAEGSLTVTASSLTETKTSTNTQNVVSSAKTNTQLKEEVSTVKQGEKDLKELQFVCSYCDKMVFRDKEYIIKHINEKHPGQPIMFSEMPYIISDNHIEYLNQKDDLTKENIFERLKDILPQEQDKMEAKLPEKTSAEADSTTEMEALHHSDRQAGLEEKKSDSLSRVDDEVCDADDEDSGSLNLKIVEVVSLKDQVQLLDDEVPCPTTHVKTSAPTRGLENTSKSTELKIPHYPRSNTDISHQQQGGHEKMLYDLTKRPIRQFTGYSDTGLKKNSSASGKVSNTFKCEKCNVHAPLLAAMVAHLRNAHKDIPRLFQCPYCRDMEAESEAKIHQHIRQFHPTDNPNPPVALSELAKRNLRTIQVHLPINIKLSDTNTLEKDIYMCLKCKLHKPSLETIYEHLEEEHSDVFVYVCPFCKTFKSKKEDVVNNHLVLDHQKPYGVVNLSLAIDGTQFTRVSCLLKEKGKGQKTSTSSSHQQKSQPHIVSALHHAPTIPPTPQLSVPAKSPVAALYQRLLQPAATSNYSPFQLLPSPQIVSAPQTSSVAQPVVAPTPPPPQPVAPPPQQIQPKPSPPVRPPAASGTKRKKNLLESIELLTQQKQREQQGLLNSASKTTTQNSSVSQTSSADSSAPSNISSLPPPLIRGPPPLIRFDQLGKPPPYSVAMASLGVRPTVSNPTLSSAASLMHHLPSSSSPKVPLESLSQIPPRPIMSSLFDTSDPNTFKPVKRGTVLNVPVVPRHKSSAAKPASPHAQPTGLGSAPLDLSKTTPSPSPQPQNMQSPPPPSETTSKPKMTPEGVNPEMFKVFNLKPTPSQPLQVMRPAIPLMQASLAQLGPAQHVMPQQVRPNTTNTLAYRPPVPHVNATAQLPQIINMGAVIGNIMVPITSLPQGFQTVQGLPTQLVQMSLAQPMVPQPISVNTSATAVSTSSVSVSTKSATTLATPASQLANLNLPMFKCPYCPKVIPLTLAQVQPHIETLHPGSSIVFTQLEK